MNVISSIDELEAIYQPANPNALAKQSDTLTAEYIELIEAAPMCALATVGPGGMDCSPRGDLPSAVTVVDEITIHLPDRRGNNRLDSLRNIVEDGRVALLFMIPGITECMRVNGTAVLRTDPDLLERYTVQGKAPASVIEITTEAVYFQCARALKRSEFWNPQRHRDRDSLPTPGEVMTAMTRGEFDGAAYDAELQDRQARTMY